MDIHETRLACASRFRYFLEYAGHLHDYTVPIIHYVAADFLEGTKPRFRSKKKQFMGFRFAAKTWLLRQYILWRWLRNPAIQIKMHSSNEDMAKEFTGAILTEGRLNPLLKDVIPDSKVNVLEWDLVGVQHEQGSSIKAAGIMTSLTGSRCDLYVFDDPEPDKGAEGMYMRLIDAFGEAEDILHRPTRHRKYWKEHGWPDVPQPERTQIIVCGQPHWGGTAYFPDPDLCAEQGIGNHPLIDAKMMKIPAVTRDGKWLWPEQMEDKYYNHEQDRPETPDEVRRRTPTERWECFLPDCQIAGSFIAASKNRYDGPAVQLFTISGSISVTANHPILTGRGWMAAKEVKGKDQLIRCTLEKSSFFRYFSGEDNGDQTESRAEDVFDIIQRSGITSASKTVSDADFHGDGRYMNGNVDCMSLYHELSSGLKSTRNDSLIEFGFPSTSMAISQSMALQSPIKSSETDTCLFSDNLCLLSHLPQVQAFIRERLSFPFFPRVINSLTLTPHRPRLMNDFACGRTAHPIRGRHLSQRHPRLVIRDNLITIKSLRHFHYSGWVYNFQTSDGVISSSGCVTTNCQMAINPFYARQKGIVYHLDNVPQVTRFVPDPVLVVDPSDSEDGCESGVCIGGLVDGSIHLCHLTGLRGELFDWIDLSKETQGEALWSRIFDLGMEFNCSKIMIEVNYKGAQTSCRSYMRQHKIPMQVIEHRAKTNKKRRIIDTTEPLFNNGLVTMAPHILKDPLNRVQFTRLTHAKLPNPNDRLDAVEMLCAHLIEGYGDLMTPYDGKTKLHPYTDDRRAPFQFKEFKAAGFNKPIFGGIG